MHMSRKAAVYLAAAAAAATAPFAVMAQTPAGPSTPAVATPGGAFGNQSGDQNASKRSDADKALKNPYWRNETWFQMPAGRKLGSISGIDVDKDGKSIWVTERCGGQDLCAGSHVGPVVKFDASGKAVKSFGADLIAYPHGIAVDKDGNIWIADLQSNIDNAARGGRPLPDPILAEVKAHPVAPAGAQVIKFDPNGKVLLRLGTPGVYGNDETHLSQPSDVLVAPNGDVFVADGHDSLPSNNRIVKYDKNGKYLKSWDACGKNPERKIDCQHALAMDSQGRLFSGNRGNNRIEIFDQEGNILDEWTQFGKPSGLYIDKNDILYAADTESSVGQGNAYIRGTHIGSAKTGQVTAFLQDPLGNPTLWNPQRGTSGGEGVVVDKDGVVYISQVTPPALARYTLKAPQDR